MTNKYYIIGGALILAVVVATAVAYPYLPSMVPTHWDAHGQVNGWSAKWTLFAIEPGIMAAMLLIFAALPWLSPKHFEVDTFRSTYLYIMVVVLAMIAYIHGVILLASIHLAEVRDVNVLWGGDVSRAIMGGVCLLIALLGNVMGKVRKNFWIGVRTPWTLTSDRVWNATHRFAGKTFVIGGLLGLLAVILRAPSWLPLTAVMSGALVPVAYSLLIYKRLEHRGGL